MHHFWMFAEIFLFNWKMTRKAQSDGPYECGSLSALLPTRAQSIMEVPTDDLPALESTTQAYEANQKSTLLKWDQSLHRASGGGDTDNSERDGWEKMALVVSTRDIGGIVGTIVEPSRDLP
ncbi:hypothetical protein mRhiFer1_009195 [Rhinolophus ferrumequinum]|uniref:Uncharacterized protein n=1 Tax=Rhinolophus ferrumequinum TaxID=59479 RepID=A0A7J7SJ90_RHIFE|nr:hypothetical protein mRhiFer1_009195 [Rhinolophus ferrumequinum]